jgi:hypothetical protein
LEIAASTSAFPTFRLFCADYAFGQLASGVASSFVAGILQILAFLVLLVFRTVDILLQDLFRGL